MIRERVDDTLQRVAGLLNRVSDDPVIRQALASVTVSPRELEQGAAQLQAALEMANRQQALTRVCEAAEKSYESAWRDARKRLRKDFQLTQAVVTADGPFEVPPLPAAEEETFDALYPQACDFYRSMLENQELLEVLCRYGLKQSRLKVGVELFEAARLSRAVKIQAEAEAQKMTGRLEAAIEELSLWTTRLTAALRSALRDDPERLQKLEL